MYFQTPSLMENNVQFCSFEIYEYFNTLIIIIITVLSSPRVLCIFSRFWPATWQHPGPHTHHLLASMESERPPCQGQWEETPQRAELEPLATFLHQSRKPVCNHGFFHNAKAARFWGIMTSRLLTGQWGHGTYDVKKMQPIRILPVTRPAPPSRKLRSRAEASYLAMALGTWGTVTLLLVLLIYPWTCYHTATWSLTDPVAADLPSSEHWWIWTPFW